MQETFPSTYIFILQNTSKTMYIRLFAMYSYIGFMSLK